VERRSGEGRDDLRRKDTTHPRGKMGSKNAGKGDRVSRARPSPKSVRVTGAFPQETGVKRIGATQESNTQLIRKKKPAPREKKKQRTSRRFNPPSQRPAPPNRKKSKARNNANATGKSKAGHAQKSTCSLKRGRGSGKKEKTTSKKILKQRYRGDWERGEARNRDIVFPRKGEVTAVYDKRKTSLTRGKSPRDPRVKKKGKKTFFAGGKVSRAWENPFLPWQPKGKRKCWEIQRQGKEGDCHN